MNEGVVALIGLVIGGGLALAGVWVGSNYRHWRR